MAESGQLIGKNWIFTLNNYTKEEEEHLLNVPKLKYLVYGREKAPETGTPHLQGYICFLSNTRIAALKKIIPRAHFEIRRGTHEQARNYCIKDKDFIETGVPPMSKDDQGLKEKQRWDLIKQLAKENRLDEIESKIYVTHIKNLEHIAKRHMLKPPDSETTTGLWIHGPSGIGKSKYARDTYPNAYFKAANKWWDGYQDQETVILDDLDKNHNVLGHHLKIWADHYSYIAENKGGAIHIRPKLLIVTSQYTIEDIWEDTATIEALNRRFKKIDMLIVNLIK